MRKQSNILRISTRGFYDLSTGKKLKQKSYFLFPKNSFEKLRGKKELVIMIHGLRNDKKGANQKFLIIKRRLKQIGYTYPVIGFSYDSNTKGAHLKKSELKALRIGQKIAHQNGKNLSQFIIDFKKQSPETKIRLIGHSLGSEVIISAIKKLSLRSTSKNMIESVYFFGSSLPNNIASLRKSGKILEKIVNDKIFNYYCPTDEVLKKSFDDGILNPLGYLGASEKTISKFKQKKVFPRNHRFVSYSKILNKFP